MNEATVCIMVLRKKHKQTQSSLISDEEWTKMKGRGAFALCSLFLTNEL